MAGACAHTTSPPATISTAVAPEIPLVIFWLSCSLKTSKQALRMHDIYGIEPFRQLMLKLARRETSRSAQMVRTPGSLAMDGIMRLPYENSQPGAVFAFQINGEVHR